MITLDGAPRRVRAGLYALLALTRPDARILPVNVTYDFMTTGRMRACVAIGEPLALATAAEVEAREDAARPGMDGERLLDRHLFGEVGHGVHYPAGRG